MITTNIVKDFSNWLSLNNKGRLVKITDIIAYTGLSRSQVSRVVNGLPKVGSKTTYFYHDVAKRLEEWGLLNCQL